ARAAPHSRGTRSRCGRGAPWHGVAYERARRPRRSSRLHAAVRPRAGGCTRARGRAGRARHVALPLRGGSRAGGLRAVGVVLSALVATVPTFAGPRAVEGGGAPPRSLEARAPACGRGAHAVAR